MVNLAFNTIHPSHNTSGWDDNVKTHCAREKAQVKLFTLFLSEDLGQVWENPLGIPSMPYVQAKCYYSPVLKWSFCLPHESCKIYHCCIRPPDQGQMGRGACVYVCVCLSLSVCSCNLATNMCFPWQHLCSLSIVGARYMRLGEDVSNLMHCETDAEAASFPHCGTQTWQHANSNSFKTWTWHIKDHMQE